MRKTLAPPCIHVLCRGALFCALVAFGCGPTHFAVFFVLQSWLLERPPPPFQKEKKNSRPGRTSGARLDEHIKQAPLLRSGVRIDPAHDPFGQGGNLCRGGQSVPEGVAERRMCGCGCVFLHRAARQGNTDSSSLRTVSVELCPVVLKFEKSQVCFSGVPNGACF